MNDMIRGVPASERTSQTVVVRRQAWLSAAIGGSAGGLAGLYLWRGIDEGALVSWLIGAGLIALAVFHLAQWADARSPLLVADRRGIRLRLGNLWHGLLWSGVDAVELHPRRGLRDGRLIVRPADPAVLAGVPGRSRRLLWWNARLHGAPLAIPLGPTTIVSPGDLQGALDALRTGGDEKRRVETRSPDPRPSAGSAGEALRPAPMRFVRRAFRVDVTRPATVRAPIDGQLALQDPPAPRDAAMAPLPGSSPATTSPGSTPAGGTLARDNMSLVLGEPIEAHSAPAPSTGSERKAQQEPAGEPVPRPELVGEPAGVTGTGIGPQLVEARRLLGLRLEEVAARTRIRPHVLEAIECDDFGPCGGDFYACGHLRTLAGTLGLDAESLIARYERHHASAPVSPRDVFEAELATGESAALVRIGNGGPRWGALVGTVLVLALIWALVSWFSEGATATRSDPPSVADGSGGLPAERVADPSTPQAAVGLRAEGGRSRVVARTASGEVLFRGVLRAGQTRHLTADEPIRVRVGNAGAVRARVNGDRRGLLGAPGEGTRLTARPE